ncbi:hypothetical protein C0991_000438 [Blastosporella zonata]|nr:hypothetical protein C0991_000438 [Blastosporella zonata]
MVYMGDFSASNAHENNLASSVASILGITGSLRFRTHGSTQKAHVVLKRVTAFDESSNGGLGGQVVRFTLIAHKRIEVKPGKELLLMVESDDGPFKDRPVVLEGDLRSPGDTLEEEEVKLPPPKAEVVVVPPIESEEGIPPKMRRAWTRKTEERKPTACIGVQIEPSYASISTQAKILCRNASSQTSPTSVSASIQVDPPSFMRMSTAVQTEVPHKGDDGASDQMERGPSGPDRKAVKDGPTPDVLNDKKERSLSPMELDSPADSPHPSPLITRSIPPISVPKLAPLSIPSRIYSPSCSPASIASTQDMQISPIELDSTASPAIPSNNASLTNGSQVDQAKSSTVRLSPSTNARLVATPSVQAAKSPVVNPFVSGGFVTDFGAPFEKARGPVRKIKVEDDEVKLPGKPIVVKSEAMPPGTIPWQRAKPNGAHPPSAPQNAVASSSKVLLSTVVSVQPVPPMRMLSGRALEKSPATYFGFSNEVQMCPPPDPKSLAYIPSGPTSNPLGIRPSGTFNAPKMPPSAPKTLLSSSSTSASTPAKKRLVVGTEWRPFVKATNNTGPAGDIPPTAPASTSAVAAKSTLLQVASYSSPSPPPIAPLPLPSFAPIIAAPGPLSTPQNKWKRMISDILPSPSPAAKPTNVPMEPCSPKTDTTQNLGKYGFQNSALLEKAQANSLKDRISLRDRISPADTSTPLTTTSTTPAPAKSKGRDLRSRISDASMLSLQTTTTATLAKPIVNSIITSPTSTLVARSPAIPSTPSQSSSTGSASISPTLAHPLPPKPSSAVLAASNKRERPNSPEPVSRKRQKHLFNWPTIDSNFSTRLMGDGQLGVRNIALCSDGSHFAISCNDRTIRIWNSRNRTEIARLAHNSPLIAVAWIDGDAGVVSLGEDGVVSKWTRSGVNHWQWAKVVDAGKNDTHSDDEHICLAYWRDRIAVSSPRGGVKVWIWLKGTWEAQRSILRQHVTAIKFVNEGAALIGGTRDGVLWHSEIPNGTLRAYAFLASRIQTLDVTPTGTHVLVGVGSSAFLVGIRRPDNRGAVEQSFICKETRVSQTSGFGAVFATEGQAVLFGSVGGCVLVWDRKKAVIVYGLEHEEDDTIQAVASFNGPTNREGYLVTGTKSGQLSWWSQPVAAA